MRCKDVVSLLHKRVFKWPRPLVLLAVGALLGAMQFLTAPFPLTWSLVVVSLAIPFAMLGIGPIPWQWTGDDAPKAKLLRGFLQALVISGIWVGLMVLVMHFWGPPKPAKTPPAEYADSRHDARHPPTVLMGMHGFTLVVALGFGWVLSEKEDTEVQKRSMEELLREAQRRALQSQLEPHVLYNALNSLAGLIQEDQERAEEAVILLADLYRMLTRQGDAAHIPLREERRLVEAYLVMEEMCLGDRLETQWIWAENEDQVMVPPLILQPLVENAIKHGISSSGKGGKLVITYQCQGSTRMLQVANTGNAPAAEAPKGVGLSNLEARLALWSGSEGTLAFARQDEWTLATVQWTSKEVV